MAEKQSGQRTEKPTPRRLREARRKGQIPRSPDLVGWITLLVASYLLPFLITLLRDRFIGYVNLATGALTMGQWDVAMRAGRQLVGGVALVFFAFLGLIMLVTIIAMAVQGGVTLSAEPLKPKWERISPKAGVKRLVSAQSAIDTAKAVVRLAALAVLLWQIMAGEILRFLSGTVRSPIPAGIELAAAILLLVRLAALLGIVVGIGDYAFQRWKVGKQLKMTKDEVKRENKNTEGDPLLRGRRRQMHARVSRNKMLAAVGDASVVVVNPTHISVALSYASGAVPTVVAKGEDELALRIREKAFEAGVPVVECRPLARLLNEVIEVGEEVPAHLYEAVAVVIAFVMRLPPTAVSGTIRQVAVPLSKLRSAPDRRTGGDGDDGDGAGGDRAGGGDRGADRVGAGRRRRRPVGSR
ncbi:MAG: EscU/YscU/HrcU family type III secretion system export apparatus switch protein [Actinomycetota bacterium]